MTESGKLPKELKDRWVNALRSGDYKQTSGVLKRTDNYYEYRHCCIGVYNACNGLGQSYQNLEDIVGTNAINTLIHLNDSMKMNFNQIADHVESNL